MLGDDGLDSGIEVGLGDEDAGQVLTIRASLGTIEMLGGLLDGIGERSSSSLPMREYLGKLERVVAGLTMMMAICTQATAEEKA